MAKINELPLMERPREKAFRYGIEKLSDIELLAILIGCGTKEKSALDIAYELLKNSKGLYNLFQTRYQDFLIIKGVKNSKAIKLAATFELGKRYEISKTNLSQKIENSDEAYQHIFPLISNQNNELFILLILNKKKEIIFEQIPYVGVEDNVPFSFKDVLCTLLVNKGYYFYIAHNHPSGDLNPSNSDIELTTKLIIESRKLGFKLLDHIIASKDGYYSFQSKKITTNR